MLYQRETSEDIKNKSKDSPVILPVGAVEAHGPHLPLGTDSMLAEKLAIMLARRVGGVVLPVLPYGQVWSLKDFPGSISISDNSLINMVYDIGLGVFEQGFKYYVIVNGHLGNSVALNQTARLLYRDCPDLKVYVFTYPGLEEIASRVCESPRLSSSFFHAEEIETSLMLYLCPQEVDMSRAIRDIPVIPEKIAYTPIPWSEFSKTAVLGDATLASGEKGEKIALYCLDRMVEILEGDKDEED